MLTILDLIFFLFLKKHYSRMSNLPLPPDLPPGYFASDVKPQLPGLSSSQIQSPTMPYGFRFSSSVWTVEKVNEWLSKHGQQSNHIYRIAGSIYVFVIDGSDFTWVGSYGIGPGIDMMIGITK